MTDRPAIVVRLQRFDDDPFGPVPAAAPLRLWTVWAMIPVAAAVAAAVAATTLGVLFYPVARRLLATTSGPAAAVRSLLAQPAGYLAAALGACLSFAGCALLAATFSPNIALPPRAPPPPRAAALGARRALGGRGDDRGGPARQQPPRGPRGLR